MNPFRNVIADLNLTAESQGTGNQDSWLHLLLAYAADREDADPVEATYSNAYREVLHRFRNYDGFASQRIGQVLSAKAMGQ
jgi:hypothetical protein